MKKRKTPDYVKRASKNYMERSGNKQILVPPEFKELISNHEKWGFSSQLEFMRAITKKILDMGGLYNDKT